MPDIYDPLKMGKRQMSEITAQCLNLTIQWHFLAMNKWTEVVDVAVATAFIICNFTVISSKTAVAWVIVTVEKSLELFFYYLALVYRLVYNARKYALSLCFITF